MVKRHPIDPALAALDVMQNLASNSDEPGVWEAFLRVREVVRNAGKVPVLTSPVTVQYRIYPTGTPLDEVVGCLYRQYETRNQTRGDEQDRYIGGVGP